MSPPLNIVKVYERSPRSALKIFSVLSHADGNISSHQMEALTEIYKTQFQLYEQSRNITIYLRALPEVTYARMVRRGRAEEIGTVSLKKVARLSSLHDKEFLNSESTFVIDETDDCVCINSKAVRIIETIKPLVKNRCKHF